MSKPRRWGPEPAPTTHKIASSLTACGNLSVTPNNFSRGDTQSPLPRWKGGETMKYSKPQLVGYSALATIQETGPNAKSEGDPEPGMDIASDPAYQADE